jgi:hypothetical protein
VKQVYAVIHVGAEQHTANTPYACICQFQALKHLRPALKWQPPFPTRWKKNPLAVVHAVVHD